MLNVMTAKMLLISLIKGLNPIEPEDPRDLDKYIRCIKEHPCERENEDISKLNPHDRHRILTCRINRHLKCSQPDEQ